MYVWYTKMRDIYCNYLHTKNANNYMLFAKDWIYNQNDLRDKVCFVGEKYSSNQVSVIIFHISTFHVFFSLIICLFVKIPIWWKFQLSINYGYIFVYLNNIKNTFLCIYILYKNGMIHIHVSQYWLGKYEISTSMYKKSGTRIWELTKSTLLFKRQPCYWTSIKSI